MRRTYIVMFIIFLICLWFIWKIKNKLQQKRLQGELLDPNCSQPNWSGKPALSNSDCNAAVVTLDQDLLLKKGDYLCEVKNLQLRINQVLNSGSPLGANLLVEDGRFGCLTEGALQATRGVKQITLNNF